MQPALGRHKRPDRPRVESAGIYFGVPTMTPQEAAFGVAAAFCLSGVVGFERQWRNRLAGLRTNTLVALGAATFVVFAALTPGEASPTRVAAQVVSGMRF